MDDYLEFLKRKVAKADRFGFDVGPDEVNSILKPHQKASVVWAVQGGRRALFEAFGLGKCHGAGTKILMADSSIKRVEDVVVGDQLMGDDGTPRNVLSLARGQEQMYRITLKNGDSYTCNESHIMSLKVSNRFHGNTKGNIVSMDIKTWDCLPRYAKQNCFKHYKVPLYFPRQDVPMDPYLYGAWLGDGHKNGLSWTINDVDQEIVAQIKLFAKSNDLAIREDPGRGCTSYFLTRKVRGNSKCCPQFYFIQGSIKAGEKRIDRRYLLNDRAVRLSVLAGIIDTDGHLIDKVHEVSMKDEGFRDDVLFLARSLGLSVSHKNKKVNGTTYYRMWISGDTHTIPCLTRKKAGVRRQIKDPLVYGFTVQPIGEGEYYGFEIDGNHLYLLEDFTVTHNTMMQLEIVRLTRKRAGGMGLIVMPLGVRQEFMRDAATLGISVKFIRRIEEAEDPNGIYLTNYETIRDGKMDPRHFSVASLDESSCLRGFGGTKTFREFMALFAGDRKTLNERSLNGGVRYRFVATATPSPNDYIELLAYAAYLGIMDVSAAKTRFFKRDSTKADHLTLHPHKTEEFWMWVSTWALFVQKPSDLGFDNTGYDLPKMQAYWHEVETDHSKAGKEKNGQIRMFANAARGVQDSAREKRVSMERRIAELREIIKGMRTGSGALPLSDQLVIWVDLNDEQRAVEKMLKEEGISFSSLYGSQDIDEREALLEKWRHKETTVFLSKPSMYGAGCNLQQCHTMIYAGVGFKFYEVFQGIHRIHRFLQEHPCDIHFIYTQAERLIRKSLEAKWTKHNEMVGKMAEIIKEYGLSVAAMAQHLTRAMGVERVEASGKRYRLVNNDCVLETRRMEENSVGLILTSIPFCYDEKTEILTKDGWKNFKDLIDGDEVGTVNPEKLSFEWQKPTNRIWQPYEGEMICFGNRICDLVVTPNHRMLVARRGNDFNVNSFKLLSAEEITREYETISRKSLSDGRILRAWRTCVIPPNPGVGERPERINIPPLPNHIKNGHGVEIYWIGAEDFMRLVGWYLSEGHADACEMGRQFGRISIAQVDGRKLKGRSGEGLLIAQAKSNELRQEICDIFVRIGLPPSIHSRQITVWCRNLAYFLIKEFGSGSKNKHIPAWVLNMHPELLTILRDTMMKGDGSRDGTAYTSFSQELRDDFQEICIKTGWQACIKGNFVHIATKQIYPEIRQAPKRIKYSGMIGCATVPNGLLVVRRNGKPCVSGNSSQYEYSPNYADMGHSDNNAHFWQQMDYLIPELFRVLQPGRIAAIHVKDRIVPGGMTGLGFQTVYPFHMDCHAHFAAAGFGYMGMKTIVTDVVRENNQTYRLGWTEQCKDGTKMGVGMPEYLLLFRKPPTDTTDGYADLPVVKTKEKYSRSRWQIDAHGFTRSSGDRLMNPEELRQLKHDEIFKLFRDYSLTRIYDFEHHVKIGETLDVQGRLPVTFMLLQPQSWSPDVWSDITRMLTLNGAQSAAGKQMHLCLARGSLVLTKERGYIPIQDVRVGEHSFTHMGRWKKVLAVKNTGVRQVVTLKAQGIPGLTITPDHKLWARKSDLVRERDGAERVEPRWIEAKDTLGAYLNLKVPFSETPQGCDDKTTWWLVGRWLADGHIDKRGSAIISCGREKWDHFSEMIGPYGGNTPHNGTAMQLQIHDPGRKLRSILERCGSGAKGKHLPPEAFTLPTTQAAALLDGYLSGDGHFIKERCSWQASSVSRELLMGMAFLVQRVHGAIASVHAGRGEREHVIDGRLVHASQEWHLGFDLSIVRKKPFIMDDGAWKKVRSIDEVGEMETWCLKVEEDESFTAEGCIVKNCPMQFDLADRAIEQWSMEGEIVYDPFAGIGTVPYRAILKKRFGLGCELSTPYFLDACGYCKMADQDMASPTIFDLIREEKQRITEDEQARAVNQ